MMYSNRLDLDRFFFAVREQIYVIVKLADFPNYYRGSDIDIFCYNKDEFARTVLSVGNCYLDQGVEIEVKNNGSSQTYVDFCFDGELEFRFDLYGALPKYERIRLKEHYIFSVIENAMPLYREFGGTQYPIYVPSPVDELILRYVEYIEWYELRPDKIKHLNYIMEALSSDPSRIGFVDKLHLYTELPKAVFDDEARRSGLYRIVPYIKREFTLTKRTLVRVISKIPFSRAVYRKFRHLIKLIFLKIQPENRSG